MAVRQPLQPLRIEPIALRPANARSAARPIRPFVRSLAVYLPFELIHWTAPFSGRHWLRRESELPRWFIALCLVATLVVSIAFPLYFWSQQSHAASTETVRSVVAPYVITTAVAASIAEPVTGSDTTLSAQVSGLDSSTQDLLRQIQQAEHDNATLRAELQAQAQSVSQTQSAAASTDAERSDQITQLQTQMNTELKSASDQIAKLTQSATLIDQQASTLRKTVGMAVITYPAISVPNLATAADPQQAIDTALASIEAHITAVTTDLQTIKSTAEKQIAAAKAAASQRPVMSGDLSAVHGNGQLSWPITGTITQPFGPTDLALEPAYDGAAHFHLGLDIANSEGTPIGAAAAGTVIFAGWSDAGYGNCVQIDHGNGLVTIYGHMVALPLVTVGQKVTAGQLIGNVGSTGNSTGPHLHFGVQYNGTWVDPLAYLP